MSTETLATLLHDRLVVARRHDYGTLLESATRADLKDSFWGRFLPFFEGLPIEDRQLLLDLTTQVAVDTVSTLLAMADDGEVAIGGEGGLWAAFAEHDEAVREP